tara:strand:- start:3973 stop:4521 length:549 start_codon:yes stop_codon:yes gene_type:complete
MKLRKTNIEGLFVLEPIIFKDNRGYFNESYNQKIISRLLGDINFVQDNDSKSSYGTLRGLHFQTPPFSQAKLVRCIKGEILDIAVDIRKKSNSYGHVETTLLSDKNNLQLFIPKGFAHGFVALSDSAIVSYKVDNYYDPNHESGILWSDKDLNINWKINPDDIIISEKDKNLRPLSEIINPF